VDDQIEISEERHRLLAEHANDVIWTMALDGTLTYVSPSVERMRGLTPEEAMAQSRDEIHPPQSRAVSLRYFDSLLAALESGAPPESFRGELEYYCKDGSTIWTDVQVIPHVGPAGEVVEILGVTRDISERKRHEVELQQARDEADSAYRALQEANAELTRLATTDALTGAWNRRHCEHLLRREMAAAARYGGPLSLLLFDIDHFKDINDAHGHQIGDQVLVELVRRVGEHVRITDLVGRWGGEEFVVIVPRCGIDEAQPLAEKLRDLIAATPFPGVGSVTISIGAAELGVGETLDDLFRRVDTALYAAKASGRNTVRLAA
jgi:diguanylate cyclase (GGDEF)-like protein/PAS domain S-box-containing protein